MTSVCLRTAALLLAVLSSFGTTAIARAAEDSPDKALAEAKDDFETAQTLFVRGEFDAAASKFLEAYGKKPYPAFLFNVAVSFEKAKQLDKAKQYFEKYLQDDPNATDAAQVKLRLDVIDKLLAPPPPPPAAVAPPVAAAPDPRRAARNDVSTCAARHTGCSARTGADSCARSARHRHEGPVGHRLEAAGGDDLSERQALRPVWQDALARLTGVETGALDPGVARL